MSDTTNIMDVTLRDGSYAVDFQFSQYETEKICCELSSSGIDYIEIGHGMGLDANNDSNGRSLCTDEEYLSAAQRCIPKCKYGMFCIPGVARVDSLDSLKEFGAAFVRVGTNVTEVEKSEPYIRRAKQLGLTVMSNYMKSYVADPGYLAENVKKSEDYGADIVYIVDSAGSMGTGNIEEYYNSIRRVSSIRVGFHGHNNLGLAVANTLRAVELGFDVVDTSLLGIGRSAGNASTELLVGNIMKNNKECKYDLKRILDCADRFVRPLWKHNPNALDLYCGIAGFHTSYIGYIRKYSIKHRVNPLDLIVRYCEYDRVNLDEKVLDDIAASMKKDDNCLYSKFGFNDYIGNEQR